jgi:hypothetical protein
VGGDALLVAVLVVLLGVDPGALTTIVAPALGWPERLNTSIGYLVASVWVTEGIGRVWALSHRMGRWCLHDTEGSR